MEQTYIDIMIQSLEKKEQVLDRIIELDIVTNTERLFTYRQASENGEFIVPYSTSGNPYDVKAVGRYRIAGTDREFDVGEEAILKGTAVN